MEVWERVSYSIEEMAVKRLKWRTKEEGKREEKKDRKREERKATNSTLKISLTKLHAQGRTRRC